MPSDSFSMLYCDSTKLEAIQTQVGMAGLLPYGNPYPNSEDELIAFLEPEEEEDPPTDEERQEAARVELAKHFSARELFILQAHLIEKKTFKTISEELNLPRVEVLRTYKIAMTKA